MPFSTQLAKGRRAEDDSVSDYDLVDQDAWELYDTALKTNGTDVTK